MSNRSDGELNSELQRIPLVGHFWLTDTSGGDAAVEESRLASEGFLVRHVRGRKMRAYSGLYDEFAAAFQFPWYFGENSDALDECLSDLDWLPKAQGIILSISDAVEVLADESDEDALAWFVRRLTFSQSEWADTSELGDGADRPPTAFQVVLRAKASLESTKSRWSDAGAVLTRIDNSGRA